MAGSSHYSSSSGVYLVDVSDKTYATIEKMIKSTFDQSKVGKGHDARYLDHCGISVTNIQKVENRTLLQGYDDFRDKLRENKYDEWSVPQITGYPLKIWQFKKESRHVDLNEIYLFHGTSEVNAKRIIREGFNIEATNPNGLYGRGIYFAEEITKADQYSDIKEDREPDGTPLRLLLCKVLMGDALVCRKEHAKKWKKPPCVECYPRDCRHGWKKRYDSVLGSGPGMLFREFVVYDENQCFPEFLVKYERIGGWEPLEPYD